MPNQQNAARFEDFARMRLEGRSDVTYRAYDLLTKDRIPGDIVTHLKAAGQYIPKGYVHNALGILQKRFMDWGFPVKTYGEIETLLHEFWVYNRIKYGGKRNWPYRDPEASQKLYDQQEEALKGVPVPLNTDDISFLYDKN